jgi:V/A-type H+-transporting ATPase subunit I
MIVPMKKVSLVVMEKYREDSLEKLRELGVLHLETRRAQSPRLEALLEKKSRAEQAAGVLRSYENPKTPAPPAKAADGADAIERTLSLVETRKTLQEDLQNSGREASRIEKWGDFRPGDLKFLEDNGVPILLYELPVKRYEQLSGEQKVIVLGRDKVFVYCALVGGALPAETPFAMPAKSLGELQAEAAEKRAALAAIEKDLAGMAAAVPLIRGELGRIQQDIAFESARLSMEKVENADMPGGIEVALITGFVPEDLAGVVKRGAMENGWAVLIDDPAETDNPPSLLRDNPFARLVHPLFNFLGTIPGYREYDVSFSYLLYFCVFFAMIFGDAAYGLILLTIAAILAFRYRKKSGKVPDAVRLFLLLSGGTIVWGAVTGSWFAAPMDKLPGFLRMLVLPAFDPARAGGDVGVQNNVQFFCFTIGITHLVYAHAKNIKRALPSLSAIGQAGWLTMMVGLYFLVLFMLLKKPMPPFTIPLIGGGLGAYFVFNKQTGGNFFRNILASLSDFLSTFLSAVSSFADIISYIRLFAVGLAGAAISQSFNGIALGMPSVILRIFAGSIILVFGHGLNLAMNTLSVVVHGVRLNLLEYAGHLGLEWSGYSYRPFALKKGDK